MERIIDNVFPEPVFNRLISTLNRQYKNWEYDVDIGRYHISSEPLGKWLLPYLNQTIPLAKKTFNSETLLLSYGLIAMYEKKDDIIPVLPHHKDNNACTYTIDVCLQQDTPWSIWVEDKEYSLKANQAIVIYGETEEHWREEFPDKDNNKVGMLFCHYVEPGHWWTQGVRRQDYTNG